MKTTIKGQKCLPWVAVPLSVEPVAVYDDARQLNPGGLPFVTSITNEPTLDQNARIFSATSAKLNFEKNSERKYYLGGSPYGNIVQGNGQVTGSIVVDKLINDDEYRLDPGLDRLSYSADKENYFLYLRLDIPMPKRHPLLNIFVYETKAAIVAVKGDEGNDAQSITTPLTYNFEGSGFYVHCYTQRT